MKHTFNIATCQDACEPICPSLGIMLNTTIVYSLISVGMTLMLTQGHSHRKTRTFAVIML